VGFVEAVGGVAVDDRALPDALVPQEDHPQLRAISICVR
jgi:hypothetical protein